MVRPRLVRNGVLDGRLAVPGHTSAPRVVPRPPLLGVGRRPARRLTRTPGPGPTPGTRDVDEVVRVPVDTPTPGTRRRRPPHRPVPPSVASLTLASLSPSAPALTESSRPGPSGQGGREEVGGSVGVRGVALSGPPLFLYGPLLPCSNHLEPVIPSITTGTTTHTQMFPCKVLSSPPSPRWVTLSLSD